MEENDLTLKIEDSVLDEWRRDSVRYRGEDPRLWSTVCYLLELPASQGPRLLCDVMNGDMM